MLKSLKLMIAAAAMSLMATSAHAVTFTPSATNSLDFGEVAIGDSKTISWELSWMLGDNETISNPYVSFSATDNYKGTSVCDFADSMCVFNVLFTPTELGLLKAEPLVQVNLGVGSASLNTEGVGISPVPLPAAFPLLAGALSLLGFFGWRRKRMAVA